MTNIELLQAAGKTAFLSALRNSFLLKSKFEDIEPSHRNLIDDAINSMTPQTMACRGAESLFGIPRRQTARIIEIYIISSIKGEN
jgi:hypothetical protein